MELRYRLSVDTVCQTIWRRDSSSSLTHSLVAYIDQSDLGTVFVEKLMCMSSRKSTKIVDCVNDQSLENPLDNEDQVQEQLEQLPNITRYQYAQAGTFLKSRFDPIAVQYQQAITTNQGPQTLLLLETQLTWLTLSLIHI